jgi:hypothetical protein
MAERRQHLVRVKHGKPEDRDRITFADLEYQPANDNRGRVRRKSWLWASLIAAIGISVFVSL